MKGLEKMIDSITLKLNIGRFSVLERSEFDGKKTRQGNGFTSTAYYLEKYRDDLKKKGIYCPVVIWTQKVSSKQEPYGGLEIQVSAPKLIYGTNLYDTMPEDIDKICNKLLEILKDIGVTTTEQDLHQAIVRQIDFAKIIKLPDYLGRADEIIYMLSRFNYRPQSKFNYHRGLNGSFMRFGNSTRHTTLYDKFGEILDKGYTKAEQSIQQGLKDGYLKRNTLKFELSIHNKSIGAVLKRRLNKQKDFTLTEVFSLKLAKEILLDAFDEIFNDTFLGLITLSEMQDGKLFAYLDKSGLTMKRQESLYYWVRMATKFGAGGAWERIEDKYSGGSVDRKRKEISLALTELGEISGLTPNLVGFLRQELNKFEIVKPLSTDSGCKPLSNDLQLQ